MLQAALDRRYSASPYESFSFTGGGLHTFSNFRKEDNGRLPTLRQALQESINLPFIRLLWAMCALQPVSRSDSAACYYKTTRIPAARVSAPLC